MALRERRRYRVYTLRQRGATTTAWGLAQVATQGRKHQVLRPKKA